MNWLVESSGVGNANLGHLRDVLLHLVVALVLAALLAYRPWRALLGRPMMASETAQAQILIGLAGGVMVAIIGDSVARAFGLVGLGGFIRFRSGIKDPRDAAVMFLMIGVGMACGLGLIPIAILTTAIAAAVLALFDATRAPAPSLLRVRLHVQQASEQLASVRRAFPGARVLFVPLEPGDEQVLVVEVPIHAPLDAGRVAETLRAGGLAGLRTVELLDD